MKLFRQFNCFLNFLIAIMENNDGKIVGAASDNAIDAGVKINEIIKQQQEF